MKYPAIGVESVMISPVAIATTSTSANLDTAGANYATIRVAIGVEKNTNNTNPLVQLLESDDTVVSNFATWNASFNRTVDNTAGTVAVNHIDLEGRKRYIRLVVTPDTTTNGDVSYGAYATLYKDMQSATGTDYGANVVVG